MKATVFAADRIGGRYMFKTTDGSIGSVRDCNIRGARSMHPGQACVFYNKGDEITVQWHPQTFNGVWTTRTRGRFDSKLYRELQERGFMLANPLRYQLKEGAA